MGLSYRWSGLWPDLFCPATPQGAARPDTFKAIARSAACSTALRNRWIFLRMRERHESACGVRALADPGVLRAHCGGSASQPPRFRDLARCDGSDCSELLFSRIGSFVAHGAIEKRTGVWIRPTG